MKKLQDMKIDELKALAKSNSEFEQVLYDLAYDDNMYWQCDWYKSIFGERNDTYTYHDNYNSFYLRLKDAERFVDSLCDTDYLNEQAKKLYDKAKALSDKWSDMTYDEQDEHEEIYEQLEQACTELLSAIEESLHEFEHIGDGDIEQQLEMVMTGDRLMDWETDGTEVYQYITKVYK